MPSPEKTYFNDEQSMVMADISANPEILFTPRYSKWRNFFMQRSPKYLDRLYESLPFEKQKDIYENNRDGWGALSNEAKGRYGANIVRTESNKVAPYVVGGLAATAAAPIMIKGAAFTPFSLPTFMAGSLALNDAVTSRDKRNDSQPYIFPKNTETHYKGMSAADIVQQNPNIDAWDKETTMAFQNAIGLNADGIIGSKTTKAFNDVKNQKYRISPTNSTERIEKIGKAYHPETPEHIEYDWSKKPKYVMSDGCSQWVRKKYDKVVGNSSEVGFHANAWQLIKKIEKAGGDMLFNIYDDKSFKGANTRNKIVNATNTYLKNNKLDYGQLEAGDVVGMMYSTSSHFGDAIKTGTTLNTHVGIVIGRDEKTGEPIIQHKVGPRICTDKISNLFGGAKVTCAVRPTNFQDIEAQWETGKSKYRLNDPNNKGYNNANMTKYMDALDGAKTLLSQAFPDVDIDELEKRAIGIMKRETDFMTQTVKDVRGNWLQEPMDALAANVREYIKDAKDVPVEKRSSNLTKTKLGSFSAKEKSFLGIHRNTDLEKPEIAARAVLYILARNADYFQNLSKTYPSLGLTKDDINNAATLSYNQGMYKLQSLGFDAKGNYAPEEIQSLRDMSYLDADKISDYNSTNYKHIPYIGKYLYDIFGSEGNYPYISSARNAIKNYLIQR